MMGKCIRTMTTIHNSLGTTWALITTLLWLLGIFSWSTILPYIHHHYDLLLNRTSLIQVIGLLFQIAINISIICLLICLLPHWNRRDKKPLSFYHESGYLPINNLMRPYLSLDHDLMSIILLEMNGPHLDLLLNNVNSLAFPCPGLFLIMHMEIDPLLKSREMWLEAMILSRRSQPV